MPVKKKKKGYNSYNSHVGKELPSCQSKKFMQCVFRFILTMVWSPVRASWLPGVQAGGCRLGMCILPG